MPELSAMLDRQFALAEKLTGIALVAIAVVTP